MKVKVSKILESVEALRALSLQKFPLSTLFKLRKNYAELEVAIKLFEDKRKELFDKYGTKKEKGEIVIETENETSYFSEINAVLDEEVEIDIQKFDLPVNYEMTMTDLSKIDYVINIPE